MQTKLKLNLGDLAVDSFDTIRPAPKEGTVFGEQCTCYTQCTCPGCPTCANYNTCDGTCGGTWGENTCAQTCEDTCGNDNTCNLCAYPPTCQQTNCGYQLCCEITGGGGC
ncbi:hypothetical protein [Longimicrobium sp.]|uniref:hypothetical protein n=1 Tax=Longimicrobium sp. TaxID=2029185 RepID=UPI003B3A9C1E